MDVRIHWDRERDWSILFIDLSSLNEKLMLLSVGVLEADCLKLGRVTLMVVVRRSLLDKSYDGKGSSTGVQVFKFSRLRHSEKVIEVCSGEKELIDSKCCVKFRKS